MNKYDTGNLSYMRKRFGLYWRKDRITWADVADSAMTWIVGITVAMALLLIAGILDANDARATAEIERDQANQQFADFMNGGILTNPERTFAAKCSEIVEVWQ